MSTQQQTIIQEPPLDRLVAFEKVSWPEEHQASKEDLAKRLQVFAQGIFLLAVDGEDVSQVTLSPKNVPPFEDIKGFEQMRDLPIDPQSKTLWITNLATKTGKRGGGYLTTLLGHVIEWARKEGYQEIVTGITCYALKEALESSTASSVQDYMEKNMNPALRAVQKGAEAVGCTAWNSSPIANYWEEDTSSLGYGVLIKIALGE